MEKKVIFSGVQPSGNLTIGNYLGAIRNWVDFQEDFEAYYCVVDMHAITVPQVPKDLRAKTLEVLAQYIACGLDPDKNTMFIQSHVPAHAELSWVLNTLTYMGELNRMTQFKEKSQKKSENLNAGLFTYPVLMAADILLYGTDVVPVGDDQKQHLELARDLAQRFNSRYSETFVVPEAYYGKTSARVMGLQNPEAKMSKSAENPKDMILILEKKDVIVSKIKSAVTDSLGVMGYNEEQKGLRNLIHIYSSFTGEVPETIVERYASGGYGSFKNDLAQVIVENLASVQDKYNDLMKNKDFLESIYKKGAEQAAYKAEKTLRKVYKKIGFVPAK